jgi:hypothetical protein
MSNFSVLLAIWNDVVPERTEEYEAWHALEHVPERVWVPGFLGATRYVALGAAQPHYLTLYEVDSVNTLETPAYADLVEHPTDWSASLRPAFRNFLRQPCQIVAHSGRSAGGWIVALRCGFEAMQSKDRLSSIAQSLFENGSGCCVTSVRIGQVVKAGPQALTNPTVSANSVEYLVIVESASEAAELKLLPYVTQSTEAFMHGSLSQTIGMYRVASRIEHSAVQAPSRPRQRTDLMSMWSEIRQ